MLNPFAPRPRSAAASPPTPADADDFPVGSDPLPAVDFVDRHFGNWRLVRQLGTGSFGSVYEAENDAISGRSAAIKILHPQLAMNRTIKQRFLNEASAASRADHENIVQVFDGGITPDGLCYSVMELLRGEPLSGLIGRGPLSVERTINVGMQVASALDAAHRGGIVHRDLKPDNIFIVPRASNPEFVKVLDFGIAKLLGDHCDGGLTRAGVAIGTPHYMSPEQWMTLPDIDGRADIYALGVILFRCLMGELPFRANTPFEWFRAHMEQPVPDLARLGARSPLMARVVRRMLSKDRDERQASMTEVMANLDWVRVEGGRLKARPNSITVRVDRPRSTEPTDESAPEVIIVEESGAERERTTEAGEARRGPQAVPQHIAEAPERAAPEAPRVSRTIEEALQRLTEEAPMVLGEEPRAPRDRGLPTAEQPGPAVEVPLVDEEAKALALMPRIELQRPKVPRPEVDGTAAQAAPRPPAATAGVRSAAKRWWVSVPVAAALLCALVMPRGFNRASALRPAPVETGPVTMASPKPNPASREEQPPAAGPDIGLRGNGGLITITNIPAGEIRGPTTGVAPPAARPAPHPDGGGRHRRAGSLPEPPVARPGETPATRSEPTGAKVPDHPADLKVPRFDPVPPPSDEGAIGLKRPQFVGEGESGKRSESPRSPRDLRNPFESRVELEAARRAFRSGNYRAAIDHALLVSAPEMVTEKWRLIESAACATGNDLRAVEAFSHLTRPEDLGFVHKICKDSASK